MGRAAKEILRLEREGWVLAAFRQSFYIQFDDDVVCIVPESFGCGPLNVHGRFGDDLCWRDIVLPHTAVYRNGPMIEVEDVCRFDLSSAKTWLPPSLSVASPAQVRDGLRRLTVAIQQRTPMGLGVLMLARQGQADAPLLSAATPTVEALRAWLPVALAGNDASLPDISALIGLGPGLTPSGDDFLCGLMAALSCLGHPQVAQRVAHAVIPLAASRTNVISAAYLRCAADGGIYEALGQILACVCGGNKGLDAPLNRIAALGHTSGWDVLAGAVAACSAIAAQRRP